MPGWLVGCWQIGWLAGWQVGRLAVGRLADGHLGKIIDFDSYKY